tara:strand:+ start:12054 stop:13187 length:1134 start_codon:yes stop_codon:yes gene_type:complete
VGPMNFLVKNVIMILIDGGRVDKAEQSKIFQNLKDDFNFFPQSITYAPYTNAAMHAVLSGAYGNRNGTYSYWHTYKFKKNKFKTLAKYLKENNYYTFADGHTELIIPKDGFDEFNIHDENTVNLVELHESFLDKMKVKNEQGISFFLYLHYSKIHTGIMNQVLKKYSNFDNEYFENRKFNEQRYDKLFQESEMYLENILKKIKNLDFFNNSIILVLSDHGISVGEKFGERAYGAFCYDYTIKTFGYLYSKELIAKTIPSQIRHVDYMPTILELLGIDIDDSFESIDGKSLVSLIKDNTAEENIAYSETGNPLNEKAPPKFPNTKSVRTSNWKLIYNEHNDSKELYNLKEDPSEENNLIDTNLEIEKFLWDELQKLQT